MNTPPVDPDREALLRALQDGGVSYVLIGGAALETHRQPHRTDDVDIAPAVDALNLEHLADVLNALDCRLVTDVDDESSWVSLPNGYFTATTLRRADVWNLHTRHGALDITFKPSGFPHGYEDLQRNAQRLQIAGTSIVVHVASLHDVEHSKRTADRPKDRDYLSRVGRLRPSNPDSEPEP
ncbi:MAG TPA: hypothetical protein VIK04_16375 [Solirubrobacteraceae bacterium]